MNSKGFVVVSGNKNVYPIVGLNVETGGEDLKTGNRISDINPELFSYLSDLSNDIAKINKGDKNIKDQNSPQMWEILLRSNFTEGAIRMPCNRSPLLKTEWHQNAPYNNSCPYSTSSSGVRTLAGCWPVGVGQILNYYRKPVGALTGTMTNSGAGFATYTYNNAASPIDWASIPVSGNIGNNSPAAQKQATSDFIYRLGSMLHSDYGITVTNTSVSRTTGSIGYMVNNSPVNNNIFWTHFKLNTSYSYRPNYTNDNWVSLLTTKLDENKPLLYGGSGSRGGHAWVVDGYYCDYLGRKFQSPNFSIADQTLFHMNWGWGPGMGNGYFRVTNIAVPIGSTTYDFNTNNGVHIITPQ